MIGIYMYTNRLNGKRYIGKSVDIEARKGKHLVWDNPEYTKHHYE